MEEVHMTDKKFSKSEVDYTDKGTVKEHCGICQHYWGQGECKIVEGKVIAPGWCDHFQADRWATQS
jgi:hypothetical protein